jgi:hypothetical protein
VLRSISFRVCVIAQDGDHKDNDYSITCTGSGCCVCGGVTAWKREGLCSKHEGAEKLVKKGGSYSLDVSSVFKYMNTLVDAKMDTKSNFSTTLTVFDVRPPQSL